MNNQHLIAALTALRDNAEDMSSVDVRVAIDMILALLAQPAPASVEDAMRARGFWWNARHCAWIQTGRWWCVQEVWSSSDGTTWTAQVDGTVFGNHPDPLAAADACERHAAQENAK